ncbi:MAG: KH domain-containing protein [bacterium]|nr:KH domain-containing protein [bacterium]
MEYVVKALVDAPDDVKIVRTVDEMGVLLTLSISPVDMGKVIGRSGNTAKAIRTLLRVVGMKNNARVNLKINEPEGGMRPERSTTKSVDEAMEDLKI